MLGMLRKGFQDEAQIIEIYRFLTSHCLIHVFVTIKIVHNKAHLKTN